MRILFIHEVNYETKFIFEIQEFPELLSLRGHKVDFLQFQENAGLKNFSLKTRIKEIPGRVYSEARINLISPPTLGGNFVDRLISTVTIIPLLFRLISKNNYDAIVLYSVPTSGWQTVLIAKFKGIPVIFRALDVSHLLRHGITEKLVKAAERTVYKNASVISANNSALGEYCKELIGQNRLVEVNYPPLDFSHFQKAIRNDVLRSHYGIKESDFVLTFMGTFYEFSGIPEVIKSLKKNSVENVKLVLVGSGVQEQLLKDLVKKFELQDHVIFTGVIPYDNLPEILAMSDVTFNSFEPCLTSNVAFPHKVLQYLATGIPTISTKLAGLYSCLNESAGVYWVDSPEEVFNAALKIKEMKSAQVENMINLGKKFIETQFDKTAATMGLEKTILQAVNGNEDE